MDMETNTKILFSALNRGTFYSPLNTLRYFYQLHEKSESKQCVTKSWLLCFSCHFLPLGHKECWIPSGIRPARCCGPPVLHFHPLPIGHECGLRPVGRQDFAAASIQLRAGRMGWLFNGIAILLHHAMPHSPLGHSVSVELIPTYSDAGKLWHLQLISNCNP